MFDFVIHVHVFMLDSRGIWLKTNVFETDQRQALGSVDSRTLKTRAQRACSIPF